MLDRVLPQTERSEVEDSLVLVRESLSRVAKRAVAIRGYWVSGNETSARSLLGFLTSPSAQGTAGFAPQGRESQTSALDLHTLASRISGPNDRGAHAVSERGRE